MDNKKDPAHEDRGEYELCSLQVNFRRLLVVTEQTELGQLHQQPGGPQGETCSWANFSPVSRYFLSPAVLMDVFLSLFFQRYQICHNCQQGRPVVLSSCSSFSSFCLPVFVGGRWIRGDNQGKSPMSGDRVLWSHLLVA